MTDREEKTTEIVKSATWHKRSALKEDIVMTYADAERMVTTAIDYGISIGREEEREKDFLLIIQPSTGKPLEIASKQEWKVDMQGVWQFTHIPTGEVFKVPETLSTPTPQPEGESGQSHQ